MRIAAIHRKFLRHYGTTAQLRPAKKSWGEIEKSRCAFFYQKHRVKKTDRHMYNVHTYIQLDKSQFVLKNYYRTEITISRNSHFSFLFHSHSINCYDRIVLLLLLVTILREYNMGINGIHMEGGKERER